MSENFTANVNDSHQFDLDKETIDQSDIHFNEDGTLHMLHEGKSFKAELIEVQREDKIVVLKVNEAIFRVSLKDDLDMLINKMGMKANLKRISPDIIAPMPGLVIKVLVKEGQEIEAGTPVLILEAMKMENVLKSEGSGTVNNIHVKNTDSVEKGQLLVQIEPS